MENISIGFPIGATFTVVIKDSSGATVYGPASQTNAPFNPGLTTPGDYLMLITVDGNTDGVCFTIPPCECPEFLNASVDTPDGVNFYFNIEFNLPDGLPCPFRIDLNSSAGFSTIININSLSDFSPPIGSVYRKTILIGGLAAISYAVLFPDGVICTTGFVAYACVSPEYTVTARRSGANCYIDIESTVQGCGNLVVNFVEVTGGGSGDMGSYSVTIPVSLPDTNSHLLSPVRTCGDIQYNITVNDCCGHSAAFSLNWGPATCDGPELELRQLRKTGSDYFIDFVFNDCGSTCHDFNFTGYQVGPFASGIGYSTPPNVPFTVPCGGSFPYTYSYQIYPNLTGTDGLVKMQIIGGDCCCVVITGIRTVPV